MAAQVLKNAFLIFVIHVLLSSFSLPLFEIFSSKGDYSFVEKIAHSFSIYLYTSLIMLFFLGVYIINGAVVFFSTKYFLSKKFYLISTSLLTLSILYLSLWFFSQNFSVAKVVLRVYIGERTGVLSFCTYLISILIVSNFAYERRKQFRV